MTKDPWDIVNKQMEQYKTRESDKAYQIVFVPSIFAMLICSFKLARY